MWLIVPALAGILDIELRVNGSHYFPAFAPVFISQQQILAKMRSGTANSDITLAAFRTVPTLGRFFDPSIENGLDRLFINKLIHHGFLLAHLEQSGTAIL
jgi:hypothetical protein